MSVFIVKMSAKMCWFADPAMMAAGENISLFRQMKYTLSVLMFLGRCGLVEPFAIGAHCTQRGRVVADDTVLILGTGTIGAIILQTCKAKGVKKIICADISDSSLERAKEYGADLLLIRSGKI